MDQLATLTGRQYHLVDYHGAPDAERVVVLMGSGVGVVKEAVDEMCRQGERVGVAIVRLYRPFPTGSVAGREPPPSTRTVVVLDRTRGRACRSSPCTSTCCRRAVAQLRRIVGRRQHATRAIGGRYGLSSKEFTPAMVKSVFEEAAKDEATQRVHGRDHRRCHPHQPHLRSVVHHRLCRVRAVFYGLGSDGTVGANKNTAKIVGKNTDLIVQAYFVYD